MKNLKRAFRLTIICAQLLASVLVVAQEAPVAQAAGVQYQQGDVFAGVGTGLIKHFSPAGVLLDTLNSGTGCAEDLGMAFDNLGNLLSTHSFGSCFGNPRVIKFDNQGNLVGPFGGGYANSTESISLDSAGNVYVGQPDSTPTAVRKFDSAGNFLASFTVARENRGSDWIDLAADQCTLFYSSEGVRILRFNVCTNTQMPDFANTSASGVGTLFALRIRLNGEVLVAGANGVLRLSSSGTVLQVYPKPVTESSFLFALNLAPDGTSFWTAGYNTGNVYRFDIASGSQIGTFNAGRVGCCLSGLAVFGEIRAATGGLALSPSTATNTVGTPHTVTATATTNGQPTAGVTVTFSVTGANTASGSCVTAANGQCTFTYTGTNAGNDTITATAVIAGNTKTATASKTWTATDQPITAKGTTFSATEGQSFSGTVATFTDPDANATASEYSASINWGDGTPTSTGGISGSGGNFTVSGKHTYTEEGTYKVTVTITDVDNPSNTATANSTANVADAPLTARPACSATSTQSYSGPTATFTDAASPSGTLSDFSATINWGDSSSSVGTVSGPNGGPYAVSGSHSYTTTGPFTITTNIKDVGGATASTACITVVFAFAPGGGGFVIGDRNAVVGNSVTFWGAQWWKDNQLSGGSAPPSFKGFAENPKAPSCGTGWSTDPGNSTPPPSGPLPAYMGVIVTSQATKNGSEIDGNTVHIVIVQTDPGYQPNPGHPGTGKVVAIVC